MSTEKFGRKVLLTITTQLSEASAIVYLNLRHTLVDTLEERGIGDVIDEGMGEDFMDVALEIVFSKEKEDEIRSILRSLGILESSELTYSQLEDDY
ncbi:MAG TPA: hypothetical protein VF191_15240 [Cyclobacteriaceae bacterium]